MRWKTAPLLLILIVLASGCLFKPPAEVNFSVDRTTVPPGGTFHLIVTVNNTGKVGLVGATLILSNENFQIVQEPKFPSLLKVGRSVQLVWILRAPEKPGTYNLQVSLELRDELKRTWTGFYGHFRITVSKDVNPPEDVQVNVSAPSKVKGGESFHVVVNIGNRFSTPIQVIEANFTLLPGMKVVSAPAMPSQLGPGQNITLDYVIKAPFAYRDGFVSFVLKYSVYGYIKSVAKSFIIETTWKPWEANETVLMEAYGAQYHWIMDSYIVDAYWMRKFNSTSYFRSDELKPVTLKVIGNATSDVKAAYRIYDWIRSTYSLGDTTTTLEPEKILPQDRISYAEAQILATAMLRSIDIPARAVTLFNGTDCTIRPITEFYTSDGWYVLDFRHGFIGPVNLYIASPYFPKVYQMVTAYHYRIVAQNPLTLVGHEHVDVTGQFTDNLENRLMEEVLNRVAPNLRSKLTLVLANMEPGERLYALFLFASAPTNNELNDVLATWNTDKIGKTVKALYEFYKDIPWKDDFTYYWKIFVGEVP